jgi:hypothetical protein
MILEGIMMSMIQSGSIAKRLKHMKNSLFVPEVQNMRLCHCMINVTRMNIISGKIISVTKTVAIVSSGFDL